MMSWQVEVKGDGVTALVAYLTQHATKEQKKKNQWLNDVSDDRMTPSVLRQASQLLNGLRAKTPTTPSLQSFLINHAVVSASCTNEEEEPDAKRLRYLDQRRHQLLRLDEEMRYRHMIHNVQKKTASHELQRHLKSVRQSLSIGTNMIVSRITAFVVVYMVSHTITDNQTTRVILGLAGAIGMMVIEMILFITRAVKYDQVEQGHKETRTSVF